MLGSLAAKLSGFAVTHSGQQLDRGVVDAATFDGSILRLKQSGVIGRRLVERIAGCTFASAATTETAPAFAATKHKNWLALERLLFRP